VQDDAFSKTKQTTVTVDESVVAELVEGLARLLIGDKNYIRRRIETGRCFKFVDASKHIQIHSD
jgi:hypothetical protein